MASGVQTVVVEDHPGFVEDDTVAGEGATRDWTAECPCLPAFELGCLLFVFHASVSVVGER